MDPFEIPDISGLDRAGLLSARTAARAEIDRLKALGNDATDEELTALESVLDHVEAIDTAVTAADTAASEREARIAAAAERAGSIADIAEGIVEAEAAVVDAETAVAEAEVEAVVASGTKRPVARAASKKAPTVIIPKDKDEAPEYLHSVTASANVPGFNDGTELKSARDLAQAFLNRVGTFSDGSAAMPEDMEPGIYKLSPRAQKFGVATIKRKEREFEVNRDMDIEQQMSIIMDAGKEAQFSGGLIAAGGWCAPSEIDYSLSGYETAAGLIDLPEVTSRRGGIMFTKGPDFMTIFADGNAGFIQTETQAEAGNTKPCYALSCPAFQEVRLDAIGFCATAPMLTEAAYPELVSRVLQLLNLGHQRRKSASTISRIRALIAGTAANVRTWPKLGSVNSGLADALAGVELTVDSIRQTLAMDPNATVEGIAPYWLRGAFRNELARRLGLDNPFGITDADVDGWFALRGVKFQYVYDYQNLTTAVASGGNGGTGTGSAPVVPWTAWPASAEVMLYPAGAFTRLTHDVANLTAVYDHDLLTQNQYTAAFLEEGIGVANTRGYGVALTLPLDYSGVTGASNISV